LIFRNIDFLYLTDTPDSYDGLDTKMLTINEEEQRIEPIDRVFTNLLDVPNTYNTN